MKNKEQALIEFRFGGSPSDVDRCVYWRIKPSEMPWWKRDKRWKEFYSKYKVFDLKKYLFTSSEFLEETATLKTYGDMKAFLEKVDKKVEEARRENEQRKKIKNNTHWPDDK